MGFREKNDGFCLAILNEVKYSPVLARVILKPSQERA